jgi:hypothetical protein
MAKAASALETMPAKVIFFIRVPPVILAAGGSRTEGSAGLAPGAIGVSLT